MPDQPQPAALSDAELLFEYRNAAELNGEAWETNREFDDGYYNALHAELLSRLACAATPPSGQVVVPIWSIRDAIIACRRVPRFHDTATYLQNVIDETGADHV